jgi:MFS family permease
MLDPTPDLPGGEGDGRRSPALDDDVAHEVAEEIEEALTEGDRPIRPGTMRSLLSHRDFRLAYSGSVASNIGTWMQNVVLSAYAYELTGSAAFVGIMIFANLGPQFIFAMPGGALADSRDRRHVIAVASVVQGVLCFALAVLTIDDQPPRAALLALVFAVGTAAAIQQPSFTALLPTLVPRHEIQGAVSLAAANVNLSRVIGPAIGGVLFATVGVSWVFVLNGATFVFLVLGVLAVRRVEQAAHPEQLSALRRLVSGFGIVWHEPVIRRAILCIASFSLLGLAFVTQYPVIATENFGVDADTALYGFLYATFAAGSLVGALSVGFLFQGASLARVVRVGLAAFAVLVLVLGLLRSPAPAFPVSFAVGMLYFIVITGMSAVVQHRVDDRVRGRVASIWMMSVAGTVPIGGLIAGWLVEATNPTVICLIGSAAGAVLVWFADLREPAAARGGSADDAAD